LAHGEPMLEIKRETLGYQKSWIDPFRDVGIALTNWTIKYVPDAWIVAVILSIVVAIMTFAWGNTDALGAKDFGRY